MSSVSDGLASARQRIAAAYEPRLLEDAGHRLAAMLAANLARAQRSDGPVLPWAEPLDAIRDARASLSGGVGLAAPSGAEARGAADAGEAAAAAHDPLVDHFAGLVKIMLERGLNLHDPRYIGHQVPAPVPLAGLFDAVGSVTNQVMAIYEMGPWATAVEQAMVRELGEAIGWAPDTFAGSVTHGGSLANLTALLTARNVALGDAWDQGLAVGEAPRPAAQPGPPILVAHAEAHYSVARAAGILGLGSRQTVRVGLDDRGRMDPRLLDEELTRLEAQGRPVVAVVACACATPTGAFDPLEDIAEVCRRHEVWLHVDAAHGGAAVLSDRHRHLLAGLELADSVVWDAHKMLFVPGLCAFVLYREKARGFDAFRQDAPYLFDPAAPGLAEYDSGVRTVECTKRAAAFGLWGVWALFGRQLFADMVDVTFSLGHELYERLAAAEDFAPLHEPQCNIVVFRHIPPALRDAPLERIGAFQLELRRRLIESGEFYIVPCVRDGAGALRVTIINPLTTTEHLDQLLDALRRHGQE
ncbi:MAG: aminotransferase class I/II-fold pyridoxal phosphate-dependent enzyme, partial [Thermoleophilia bacterium]|nr:aminotransferase class I/II-fold pyridoxal phosphate-dependent enzyme [Thermoleophilia bacterium]